MSSLINFKEIADDARFERFVEDLLLALGWRIIFGAGKGPDGGRDILAEKDETTIVGRIRAKRYVFQCKHFAHSEKTVSPSSIGEFLLVPTQHGADGWLLVTSTRVSTDSVAKIEAARRAQADKDFDKWDAEYIERIITEKPECRPLLRQYFPISYAKLNGTLIPSRLEIQETLDELFMHYPVYKDFFFYNDETENNLLAEIVSSRVSLARIRDLLTDSTLHQEFSELWSSNLKRGDVKGSALLLFRGLNRLSEIARRGLPSPGRDRLVAAELRSYVYYREITREYWDQFIAYSGLCPDGIEVRLDPAKIYCPPFPIWGLQFVLFCKARNGAAVAHIQHKGSSLPFPKVFASNAIETGFQLNFAQPIPPEEIILQIKTEPGSDPIYLICNGHSDGPGVWNTLI